MIGGYQDWGLSRPEGEEKAFFAERNCEITLRTQTAPLIRAWRKGSQLRFEPKRTYQGWIIHDGRTGVVLKTIVSLNDTMYTGEILDRGK